ncbi:MAG: hypothetical protein ACTIJJ_11870 [Galactobacter sp.]|uniref:hypothetical protein n=1 Tax=Galactobacter sp. TaxID=2676125 RepID=UPI0025BA8FE2|nr:hypothetical protein [Galactobacter sp.]
MDVSSLPNIVLEAAFGKTLGLAPNGLLRMADEGTLPQPFARRGTKPVWSESDIESYFATLQPAQSAYAPIDPVLGADELLNLESYVCPAQSSGHIGNRRPNYLALYRAGQTRNAHGRYEIDVYQVEWVQTQEGVAGETRAAPAGVNSQTIRPVPWFKVRPEADYPLTLFKLDIASKRVLEANTGVRRGGTISTASLQAAFAAHGKAVHFKDGEVHLVP